jgi:hypothetical protein
MSVKSTVIAIALVGAMTAPVACLAQGGAGGAGAGASGAGSSGSGASGPDASGSGASGSANPGNAAGSGNENEGGVGSSTTRPAPDINTAAPAPPARPVLPAAPAQNSNMTWDGDRLRPNNYRITHRVYSRARTALTPFDVHPFSGTYAFYGYYDNCCLVRHHLHYGRRVLRVRG